MWLTGRHITSQISTKTLTRRVVNSPSERKSRNSSGAELTTQSTWATRHKLPLTSFVLWSNSAQAPVAMTQYKVEPSSSKSFSCLFLSDAPRRDWRACYSDICLYWAGSLSTKWKKTCCVMSSAGSAPAPFRFPKVSQYSPPSDASVLTHTDWCWSLQHQLEYRTQSFFVCVVIYVTFLIRFLFFLGMAFALLASLPAVNGLYSSFFPLIPYFFMGTAHQMVPGKSEWFICSDFIRWQW